MEDVMRGYRVPAFGSWNFAGDDQEKARKDDDGGFVQLQAHFFVKDGENLFKVLSSYNHQPQKKAGDEEREWSKKKKKKKKKEVDYYYEEKKVRRRPVRAVDEDLYKIPSELLHIPKKRNLMKNFLGGFLCLSCIA